MGDKFIGYKISISTRKGDFTCIICETSEEAKTDNLFFRGGPQVFKNQVLCAVPKNFQISHQERAAFTYLGLQMKQLPNAIRVHQSSYVSDISPIIIQKARNKFDKLTDDESHQLKALAGQDSLIG